MRRLPLLIVVGAISFLSAILTFVPRVDAQTNPTASDTTAVVGPGVKEKIGPRTISKAIINEASRLKNDAAGWEKKLQEPEVDLDLKKSQ